jgi:UPF0755 protein
MRKVLIIAASIAVAIALFLGITLLVVSNGSPLNWARLTLLRIEVASQSAALDQPAGQDPAAERFSVAPGETVTTIARRLADAGLLLDPDLFVKYLVANEMDTQIEASTFFLQQTDSPRQIAQRLVDSRDSFIPFQVLAGQRLEEIAEYVDLTPRFLFDGDDVLRAMTETSNRTTQPEFMPPTGATLEGYLGAGYYELPPSGTAAEFVESLLGRFAGTATPELLSGFRDNGLSLHEAVALASIAEREAVHSEELPRIASVYLNRLAIGMLLQADPTVQYGLHGSRGAWWPAITQGDYRLVDSPYNTYLYPGLPPGPIANPSLDALRAVAFPEQTPYLYFRARCDQSGFHVFAITYEEHLANGCG